MLKWRRMPPQIKNQPITDSIFATSFKPMSRLINVGFLRLNPKLFCHGPK